ncbi:MAG: hypothetical protein H0U23_15170 [Blastocatellia bacterium]|nr:hypothetical protein [Blastocatellia bacterium]
MKVVSGSGPRTASYPPQLQELYNWYPQERSDAYSFRFRGTSTAVDEFINIAKNGLMIRPVLDLGGLQQIRLTAFRLKIADDGTIEAPKRIETPATSEALRRLQMLQDTTVSQEMLRLRKRSTIQADNAPLGTVAHVPPLSKIRVVASGLVNHWDQPPRFAPDYIGGLVLYYLGGQGPAKAGYVWTWENRSATTFVVTARVRDDGNKDNNTGSFTLDSEVVPIGVPFGPLPEAEQLRQAELERSQAEKLKR